MPTSFLKSIKEGAAATIASHEALLLIEHSGRILIGGLLSYQETPITGAPFLKALKMDCLGVRCSRTFYGTKEEQADFAALSSIEKNDLDEIMASFLKSLTDVLSSSKMKKALGSEYQILQQSVMKQFTHILSCAFLYAENLDWYSDLEKELLAYQDNSREFSNVIDKICARLCNLESKALFPPAFYEIFKSEEWNQWKRNPNNFRSSLINPALVRNGYISRITALPSSNTLEERERIFDEISFISLPAKTKKMLLGNPSVKEIVNKKASRERESNDYNKPYNNLLITEKASTWKSVSQLIMTMSHHTEAVRHYILSLSRNELKEVLDDKGIWSVLQAENARLPNEERSEHLSLMFFLKMLHIHCRLEQSQKSTEDKVIDFVALLKTMWMQNEAPEIDARLKHHGFTPKEDYYEGFRNSLVEFYTNIKFTIPQETKFRKNQGQENFCSHKDKIIETAILWYIEYLSYLKTHAKTRMNVAEDSIFEELKKLRGNGIDLLLEARPSVFSAPGQIPRCVVAEAVVEFDASAPPAPTLSTPNKATYSGYTPSKPIPIGRSNSEPSTPTLNKGHQRLFSTSPSDVASYIEQIEQTPRPNSADFRPQKHRFGGLWDRSGSVRNTKTDTTAVFDVKGNRII